MYSITKIYYPLTRFCCFLLLAAGIGLFSVPVQAQSSADEGYTTEEIRTKSKLSKADWERFSNGIDYSNERRPEEEEEEERDRQERDREQITERETPEPWSAETRNIIKYTLFGVVILVLAFIAFRLVMGGTIFGNKKVKKEDSSFTIEDIEDNLHDVDVESFLREALTQKDYRLAIRLYYLAIIKALSLAGTIVWKKNKTNGVYLREMRQHPQYRDFQHTTRIYEYAWFNNEDPFTESDFETVRPTFRSLLDAVEKSPKPQNL